MRAVEVGRTRRNAWLVRVACTAVAAVMLAPMFEAFPSAQANGELRVVSNPRPDMVSGGDALDQG